LQQATIDCAVLASEMTDLPVLLSVLSPPSPGLSAMEFPYCVYGGKPSSKVTSIRPPSW